MVAALHGAVLGGGLELALAAHLRVADETAFYALPEGRLGIYLGGGGSVRIGRVIGPDRVREMMLTGRRLDAEEGGRLGLHHYTVGEGEALSRALELASTTSENAPLTNRLILSVPSRVDDVSREHGLFLEALTTALT